MSDQQGAVSTADIIAALRGNWAALKKVRGAPGGYWLRSAEGEAAAVRLAELETEVQRLRGCIQLYAPPRGERIAGIPPWQAGRHLTRGTK